MKPISLRILLCTLALLLGVEHARALTIPVSEDTTAYLKKITSLASNSSNLSVDSSHVVFLYFNLDDIPEGSVVKLARLRFYTPSVRSKGTGLGVHRVLGQWNEAIPGTQPEYDTTPIAMIDPEKLGSRRFVTVDVTAQVQDWINFAAENEGFAITPLNTGNVRIPPASVILTSKEGPALGLPAILDIELQDVAESDAPISAERLPAPLRAFVESGTLKLNSYDQLPDPEVARLAEPRMPVFK